MAHQTGEYWFAAKIDWAVESYIEIARRWNAP